MDIYEAIIKGDRKKVGQLANLSIDIDQTDTHGDTPLCVAMRSKNPELVEVLLKAGAAISIRVLNILEDGEEFDCRILKLLIHAGLDVNSILEERETFVMLAAQRGELEAVRLLVAAGADVNLIDRDGHFPLLNAGSGKHAETFRYLAPLTSQRLRNIAENQLPSRFGRMLNNINSCEDNGS